MGPGASVYSRLQRGFLMPLNTFRFSFPVVAESQEGRGWGGVGALRCGLLCVVNT